MCSSHVVAGSSEIPISSRGSVFLGIQPRRMQLHLTLWPSSKLERSLALSEVHRYLVSQPSSPVLSLNSRAARIGRRWTMELFTLIFLVGAVNPIKSTSSIFVDLSSPRFFKLSPQVLRMVLALYMEAVSLLVLVSAEYLLLLLLLSRSVPPRRFGGVSRAFSRSWCVIGTMISEIGSLNDLLTRLLLEL